MIQVRLRMVRRVSWAVGLCVVIQSSWTPFATLAIILIPIQWLYLGTFPSRKRPFKNQAPHKGLSRNSNYAGVVSCWAGVKCAIYLGKRLNGKWYALKKEEVVCRFTDDMCPLMYGERRSWKKRSQGTWVRAVYSIAAPSREHWLTHYLFSTFARPTFFRRPPPIFTQKT